MKNALVAALLAAAIPVWAFAADWEDLCKDGYAVVAKTAVPYAFNYQGCEYDRHIPLENGLVFVCREYSYHYAYHPDVYILQHIRSGDVKVVIDNDKMEGQLYKAPPTTAR